MHVNFNNVFFWIFIYQHSLLFNIYIWCSRLCILTQLLGVDVFLLNPRVLDNVSIFMMKSASSWTTFRVAPNLIILLTVVIHLIHVLILLIVFISLYYQFSLLNLFIYSFNIFAIILKFIYSQSYFSFDLLVWTPYDFEFIRPNLANWGIIPRWFSHQTLSYCVRHDIVFRYRPSEHLSN